MWYVMSRHPHASTMLSTIRSSPVSTWCLIVTTYPLLGLRQVRQLLASVPAGAQSRPIPLFETFANSADLLVPEQRGGAMIWASFIAVRTRSTAIPLYPGYGAIRQVSSDLPLCLRWPYFPVHPLPLARKTRHITHTILHSPFMDAPHSFIASLEGYLCSFMVILCTSNTKSGKLLVEIVVPLERLCGLIFVIIDSLLPICASLAIVAYYSLSLWKGHLRRLSPLGCLRLPPESMGAI